MSKMFSMMEEVLLDVLESERGNKKFKSKKIFVPDQPKKYSAKEIKKIRIELKFTQSQLAQWLNVSLNTIQAWEQGTRKPSHSALRLLEIFDKNFSAIVKIFKIKPKTNKKIYPQTISSHSLSMPIAAKSRY